MTSQHKSSTSPEVEFRINYLKQSMHVISTSRPSQTNSGPSSFSRSHSLCYSLIGMAFMAGVQQLFPSTCFSLNASPLPGTGSQTTGLLQRMESSPIAHRRPAETIDANLLMTLTVEVIKASTERQEASSSGGAARLLPTWTQQQSNISGKKVIDATVPSWGPLLRSNHRNDDLIRCLWANLLAFINATTQGCALKRQM